MEEYTSLPEIIPRCMERLRERSAFCTLLESDHIAMQRLENFGRSLKHSPEHIRLVCDLASGFSDIVVLVKYSLGALVHHPDQSFDDFVDNSVKLRFIDRLIRFATKDSRSIHTVTVVHPLLFPGSSPTVTDQRREEALAEFLQTKKAKVILHCVAGSEYVTPWMKERFRWPDEAYPYQLSRRDVSLTTTNDYWATVIPVFCPSQAMEYQKYRLELRILLMYKFLMAFRVLRGKHDTPCCAEKIRAIWLGPAERLENQRYLILPEIAMAISERLSSSYASGTIDINKPLKCLLGDEGIINEVNYHSYPFRCLSFWISLLLKKPYRFNTFGTSYALFCLRRISKREYDFFPRLPNMLLDQHTPQDHWFQRAEGDKSNGLTNDPSKVPATRPFRVSDLIASTKHAYKVVSALEELLDLDEIPVEAGATGKGLVQSAISVQRLFTRMLFDERPDIGIDQTLRIDALSRQSSNTMQVLVNRNWNSPGDSGGMIAEEALIESLLDCLQALRMEVELVPDRA
ncbi:hypothetical protein BJX99DRAFT_264348 [Aspergillus californicus]